MKWLSLIIICLLNLTACTTPNKNASVIPSQNDLLKNIDLETIVIQTGDLPPMQGSVEEVFLPYSGGQRPGMATSFARLIKKGDVIFGSIYVDIYVDRIETKKAYDDGINNLRDSAQNENSLKSPAVGEYALLQYSTRDDSTVLIFLRCHAYVNISLPASEETTLAYAKRLDARLNSLACLQTN